MFFHFLFSAASMDMTHLSSPVVADPWTGTGTGWTGYSTGTGTRCGTTRKHKSDVGSRRRGASWRPAVGTCESRAALMLATRGRKSSLALMRKPAAVPPNQSCVATRSLL